ncbi:MAG: hypothetical protein FWF70_00455, partial [Bacteroidetes bacterium]|nr:hypothetical protein [Bacteroidota bacterium]
MKKSLFILGLFLSFAFLNAQINLTPVVPDDDISADAKIVKTKHISVEKKNAVAKAREGGVVLWDNTNINVPEGTIPGGTAAYWGGNDNWAWPADDFDADGEWIIEKVYSKGFHLDPDPTFTDKMALVFYLDDNGKPGQEIYRNTSIKVADILDAEIVLPVPFQLPGAGKYWITIAASYENISVATNSDVLNNRIYILRGKTSIGANYHYYDKLALFTGYSAATWIDASTVPSINPKLYSTYFRIEGDPNVPIDCQPITDFKAVAAPDCS